VIKDANDQPTTNAYDAAGNLISVTDALNRTTHYTYDDLNRQIAVTDPLENTTRSVYDRLGNLFETVDANGVVTRYEYDELNRQIAVTLNFKSGPDNAETNVRGVIGQKASDWLYSLPDGLNTPRQLANATGEITLAGRYTPWGDILEVHGTGSFTFGYLGGIMDLASGLIYVGNGQYYDPSTGRFLTRSVNPDSTNPYVPWNPIGAIVGPLGLFSLVAMRKRGKPGKENGYLLMLFILIVLPLSVGLACKDEIGTPTEPVNLTVTVDNGIVTATATIAGQTYTATAPISTPIYGCSIVGPIAPNDTEISATISQLADYVFGAGNSVKAISSRANRGDVESYLRRLMEESGRQGLTTNQLAYIYATAHVESGWGDFEEKYEGDPEQYFDDRYGPESPLGPQLGNTQTGDGYRYMGRGFIHLTGRANYLRVSQALGLGTDLENIPYKAECGLNCPYNYDYVTNIAVTGMKNGLFTGLGLLSPTLSGPDGSFAFYSARPIIGWPGDSSSQQAGDLGVGFAKILSAHCPLGGALSGLVCVVCP
jgi:YD repeat-containing protein